jgi:hypothetical protein
MAIGVARTIARANARSSLTMRGSSRNKRDLICAGRETSVSQGRLEPIDAGWGRGPVQSKLVRRGLGAAVRDLCTLRPEGRSQNSTSSAGPADSAQPPAACAHLWPQNRRPRGGLLSCLARVLHARNPPGRLAILVCHAPANSSSPANHWQSGSMCSKPHHPPAAKRSILWPLHTLAHLPNRSPCLPGDAHLIWRPEAPPAALPSGPGPPAGRARYTDLYSSPSSKWWASKVTSKLYTAALNKSLLERDLPRSFVPRAHNLNPSSQ